jgi:hypothetical protein
MFPETSNREMNLDRFVELLCYFNAIIPGGVEKEGFFFLCCAV